MTRPDRPAGVPSIGLLARFWDDPVDYDTRPPGPVRRTVGGRIGAALAVFGIGVILASAWHDTTTTIAATGDARAQLRDEVTAARDTNNAAADEAGRLRDEVAELRDRAIGDQTEVDKLHDAEALAGLRAVTGDGITVTVTAGPGPTDPRDTDRGRVYDRDLQLIVNAVWAFGAEAVAIDDQRLTATSAIRSAGDAILVDFAPVTSPYRITAIGPADLADRLRDSPVAATFDEYRVSFGITMEVTDTDDLRLPAAAPPPMDNVHVKEPN